MAEAHDRESRRGIILSLLDMVISGFLLSLFIVFFFCAIILLYTYIVNKARKKAREEELRKYVNGGEQKMEGKE